MKIKHSLAVLLSLVILICSMPRVNVMAQDTTEPLNSNSKPNYTVADITEEVFWDSGIKTAPKESISCDKAAEIGMQYFLRFFNQYYDPAKEYKVEMFYLIPQNTVTNDIIENNVLLPDELRERTINATPKMIKEPAKWVGHIYVDKGTPEERIFNFAVVSDTGEFVGIIHRKSVLKDAVNYKTTSKDFSEVEKLARNISENEKLIKGEISSAELLKDTISIPDASSYFTSENSFGYSRQLENEIIYVYLTSSDGENIRLAYRSYDKELVSVLNKSVSTYIYAVD